MQKIIFLAPLVFILSGIVYSANYNECILKNMRGTTDKTAANSIQLACLHESQKILPNTTIDVVNSGAHSVFVPQQGFFVTIENRTGYTLTKFIVRVWPDKSNSYHDYPLDFFEPWGVSAGNFFISDYNGLEFHSIMSGQTTTFRVPITEWADSTEDFGKKYGWRIVKAWGF